MCVNAGISKGARLGSTDLTRKTFRQPHQKPTRSPHSCVENSTGHVQPARFAGHLVPHISLSTRRQKLPGVKARMRKAKLSNALARQINCAPSTPNAYQGSPVLEPGYIESGDIDQRHNSGGQHLRRALVGRHRSTDLDAAVLVAMGATGLAM